MKAKKLFIQGCLLSLLPIILSCQGVIPSQNNNSRQLNNNIVSNADLSALQELAKKEALLYNHAYPEPYRTTNDDRTSNAFAYKHNITILVKPESFFHVRQSIIADGGTILFSDPQVGYLHVKISSQSALDLIDTSLVGSLAINKVIPFKIPTLDAETIENSDTSSVSNSRVLPTQLMKTKQLARQFEEQYGQKLDGSSVAIAVVDTGLDITRTDVFQDRITGLRSIRTGDHALIKKATFKIIEGTEYIITKIKKRTVLLERTAKLSADRDYYLGYFTEKQFNKVPNSSFNHFDFNQDEKDTAVFPIVVFQNDDGNFEAYINVNDKGIYGEKGDRSIEDENTLMDFNWVAQNIQDRFYHHPEKPLLSYYKYTTRMDIKEKDQLTPDRNKGRVNLAITLGVGYELTEDGKLAAIEIEENYETDTATENPGDGSEENSEENRDTETDESNEDNTIYKVGLAGFDLMGHGTHCAGIAAGNFQNANHFSATSSKAKIFGLSLLGPGFPSYAVLINTMIQMIKERKVSIFNFSFGGNTEFNDTNSPIAKLYEQLIQTYNISIVKSAGNEGPGLNSHGIPITNSMITVASYFNTESRKHHDSTEILTENQNFVTASSSRGPMINGVLKPDIGAPGWVLSSMPISRPFTPNGTNHSFQFWSGTSMAAPNVASVIALLYDAVNKSQLTKSNNTSDAPVRIDQVIKALRNSALPYDEYITTECISNSTFLSSCQNKEQVNTHNWLDGGAGRVNALGAWNILQNIIEDQELFIKLETGSRIHNYHTTANGHFSYDYIDSKIVFSVSLKDQENSLANATDNEVFNLSIEGADWLSFSPTSQKLNRVIDVFSNEVTTVTLFVDKSKLIQNGRLRPGTHFALIKGFSQNHPEYFDFIFPVILVGAHTKFNPIVDNHQFAVSGFVPTALTKRYFIAVSHPKTSLLLDLFVSQSTPGSLAMKVFKNGLEIPYKNMGAITAWATNNPDHGEGRNHLRYILTDLNPGMYEIGLYASSTNNYYYGETPGSYFNLHAAQYSVSVGNAIIKTTPQITRLILKDIQNNGSPLRMTKAEVKIESFKKYQQSMVKHKEFVNLPIMVPVGFKQIKISTAYYGTTAETDIDLFLLRANKIVAGSNSPNNNEFITQPVTPGLYKIRLEGFNIPAGSDMFEVTIVLDSHNPVVLSQELKTNVDNIIIKPNYRWDKLLYFNEMSVAINTTRINAVKKPPAFKPMMTLELRAKYGNADKDLSIYQNTFDI